MNHENFWYRLIEIARKKDIIIDGLTIPFMLGAHRFINPDYSISGNSITKLLTEIAGSDTEEKAVLKCSPTNQYIITLRNVPFCKKNLSGTLSFKNKKGIESLFITEEVTVFGETIDDISKALHQEYKFCLTEEAFSWDDRTKSWSKFNDTEKEIITEAAK